MWRFWIALSLLCLPAPAEIVDRIAVVVGSDVILDSDIHRDVLLTSFLNKKAPDLSLPSRKASASHLIDQALIRAEIHEAQYPIASIHADALILQLRKNRGPSEETYLKSLARYRITEAEIKERLYWQSTVLAFIDARFRPEVSVTALDVEDYLKSHPGSISHAREALANQQIDVLLNSWLLEARKATRIVYLEESLQ